MAAAVEMKIARGAAAPVGSFLTPLQQRGRPPAIPHPTPRAWRQQSALAAARAVLHRLGKMRHRDANKFLHDPDAISFLAAAGGLVRG